MADEQATIVKIHQLLLTLKGRDSIGEVIELARTKRDTMDSIEANKTLWRKGMRVKVKDRDIRPKHLRGREGVIQKVNPKRLIVLLDGDSRAWNMMRRSVEEIK
jgi:hypothetical protein